ncbi:hypothetical protein ABBQ38_003881 [Trebouxia sp. C0009 RCD-2024]
MQELELASRLAAQIQSVSRFLKAQNSKDLRHSTAANAFNSCTVKHIGSRIASLQKRQVNMTAVIRAATAMPQDFKPASAMLELGLPAHCCTGLLQSSTCLVTRPCIDSAMQQKATI